MNATPPFEKPRLVDTGKGFSVSCGNRFLYSRYAPQAAAETVCAELIIEPGTLVFCFSPLLFYGVQTLLSRLKERCFVVCVEADSNLYDLSLRTADHELLGHPAVHYSLTDSQSRFAALLSHAEKPENPFYAGNYRRCVFLNLSGGVSLHEEFYQSLKVLADDWLSRFWKNRVTLIKMGKLYARNLFGNLPNVPQARVLAEKKVQKPLLVFGAGPSADTVLDILQKNGWRRKRENFCVLAADSALVPLLRRGIYPDAVIALESQLANEKAFIGAVQSGVPLIADITSRPAVTGITGGPVAFIVSQYAHCGFLDKIRKLLPGCRPFEPLGSVGLAALETALILRESGKIPVFTAGLDFSYQPGKTHCRQTPAHINALTAHNRLIPLENPAAAYRQGAFFITARDGTRAACDPALEGYGKQFAARYAGQKNVFTLSSSGMDTGLPFYPPHNLPDAGNGLTGNTLFSEKSPRERDAEKGRILTYLRAEHTALLRLKNLLEQRVCTEEVLELIREREYLFLHFPDGHQPPVPDTAFLNRVGSELGVFLKDIKRGVKFLES